MKTRLSDSNTPQHQKLLHHIAVGAGFCFLIAWFYFFTQSGFFEYVTALFPEKYAGSGLLVAIMVSMVPAFFIWKLWTRFMEKKLNISGIYYEDAYYNSPIVNPKEAKKADSQESRQETETDANERN